MARSLADRVNHLFANKHPVDRGPYTNAEVAAATGISESYLGYLRSGARDNPTVRHLRLLAAHFDVPVCYLVDDEPTRDADTQIYLDRLLQTLDGALQRTEVQELVMLLAPMSADSIAAMMSVADRLTRLERAKGRSRVAGKMP